MPEEDTNAQIAFNQRRDVRKTGSVAAWSLLCIDDLFRYESPRYAIFSARTGGGFYI